ncbi:MAG: thermonuclease family protein [Bacilli bacterium]|jgi:endonuclease YncB( thermonuclease family)|nr:thermonuclease family protein [Bacilli bacterium]
MRKNIIALAIACLALPLMGCQSVSSVSSSGDSSSACDGADYVSKVKLTVDYHDHHFLTDGIGQVNLNENIDGDTTHFYDRNSDGSSNRAVKIASRYLCIDTPESTGQVQPWGKWASEFTAAHINSAKTIVISSNFTDIAHAKADSTGVRWLSYVWVSEEEDAPYASLKLLNLMIVVAGWSAAKSASDSIYATEFYAADAQAQCNKVGMFCGSSDPRFTYGDATQTTLRELINGKVYNDETSAYDKIDWTDEKYHKVAFDATVAFTQNQNAFVYADLPDYDDPNITIRYGLYIFTGYRNISPLYHIGWKLNIPGIFTSYNGNYQLTNVQYNALYHDANDITILDKTESAYDAPTITPAEGWSDDYLNVVVQMNGLHGVASGSWADSDGGAFTVLVEDGSTNKFYLRFDKGTLKDRSDGMTNIDATNYKDYLCAAGETFNIEAPIQKYINTKGTVMYQLVLCHNNDLVFNS